MTEEELQAILAEHGGERGGDGKGRHIDPAYKPKVTSRPWPGSSATVEVDNPTPPNWIIIAQDGTEIRVQPQEDGTYVPIKVPRQPTARAQAPATIGAQGGRYWDQNANDGKGAWVEIPPTAGATRPGFNNVNGTLYDDQGNVIGVDANTVTTNQETLRHNRASEDRQNATAQAQAETQRLNALIQAGQLTRQEADSAFDRWLKLNIDVPMRLAEQEQQNLRTVETAGTAAGTARVNDLMGRIPYTYSGDFLNKRSQILDAGNRGLYGPASAVGAIHMPDLAAQREQAASQERAGVMARFGIDQLPPSQMGAIPYTGLPPGAGEPVLPAEDEEATAWARGLAAQVVARRRPVPMLK